MDQFQPTHFIRRDRMVSAEHVLGTERVEVMLRDGQAWTRAEWESGQSAAYTVRIHSWYYCGEQFAGGVERLAGPPGPPT